MGTSVNKGFQLMIGNEIVSESNLQLWVKKHAHNSAEWIVSIAQFLENWFDDSEYLVVKTSGSTGKPKNIQILKSRMIASAIKTNDFFNLTNNSTALLALSANYIAGKMMLVRALVGRYMIYAIEPQSNPLSAINYTIDFAPLVPMQVLPFLEEPHTVKTILLGGAPVPSSYINLLRKNLNTNYFLSFGMTETISHIALRALNGHSESEYFTCVKGVSISTTTKNQLVIDASDLLDTPLETNDIVSLKNQTEFKWLGRADFIINSGGVKIHPEEVEKRISPYLNKNFFVWKEDDNILQERVVLVIEGNQNTLKINTSEWYKDLHSYEKPKAVYVIPTFCYTESGKIKRKSTFQLAQENRG